ncbi:MAG: hypothetical protein A2283_06235 [Lentisphaerae bacterium RIFOXYA12_FULL_48_11]|nr:MAG: hypothetical protein A2283_06235 [Lentisphaerae bacterium RIFOXYA12_FULL_48_11]
MGIKRTLPDAARQAQLRSELRRDIEIRQKSYRERALKLFPHVCARCGREFDGKRLRELTVHHRDHNHDNNPNDGSNWELLCLYCHDHEHEKYKIAGYSDGAADDESAKSSSGFNAFDNLDELLKSK